MIIRKIREAFGHIKYFDEPHTYFDTRTGKKLTSVTTKLKEYIPDFDEEYWANFKAAEQGVSTQQMLALWHVLRVYGTTKGSLIHDYLEYLMQGKVFPQPIPEFLYAPAVEKCYKLADMFLKEYLEQYVNIGTEVIVGNKNLGGQIDNLAETIISRLLAIIDYKTDKEIEFNNQWGNKLKAPFDNMDECELSKYTLQTNTYKHLFEEGTQLNIDHIKIVWINEDNECPKWIDVPILDNINAITQ